MGDGISLFTQRLGIKAFASKGKVEIQAHSDNVEIIADKTVKIISANEKIEVAASKELLLTCGGAYIRFKGGNIEIHVPGVIDQKAGSFPHAGPVSLYYDVKTLTPDMTVYDKTGLVLIDTSTHLILPNRRFRTIDPITGQSILGVSDDRGEIESQFEDCYVEVMPEEGRAYFDGALKGNKLFLPNKVHTGLAYSTGVDEKFKVVNSDRLSDQKYINWLKETNPGIEKYIHRHTTAVSTDKVVVTLESVPNVPKGSNLITVKALMNNFRKNQSKASEIKYCNFLEGSPVAADKNINKKLMSVINQGMLPKQYFYVLGHANPKILLGYKKPNGHYNYIFDKTDAGMKKLLKILKDHGYEEGHTIVFLACQIGNKENPFAEVFSKIKGVGTVYGFTALGWFGMPFFTAARFKSSKKELVRDAAANEVYGHWRIFNTATVAKSTRLGK